MMVQHICTTVRERVNEFACWLQAGYADRHMYVHLVAQVAFV
jgi:hypothetical protein